MGVRTSIEERAGETRDTASQALLEVRQSGVRPWQSQSRTTASENKQSGSCMPHPISNADGKIGFHLSCPLQRTGSDHLGCLGLAEGHHDGTAIATTAAGREASTRVLAMDPETSVNP